MSTRALIGSVAAVSRPLIRSSQPLAGPFVEFLLVGGATLLLFPLSFLLRKGLGLDASEYAVGFAAFYGAYVVNDPHFSITYILFYKGVRRRAFGREFGLGQRVRYIVAGGVVPLILLAWGGFALASRSANSLGWMIQLMYLHVGWHYVKQGFGVLAVLSSRRGVRFTPRERWILLSHAYVGWAYAWASPAAAAGEFEERGVVYRALAHPRWFEIAAGVAFAVSAVATLGVIARRLVDGRAPRSSSLSSVDRSDRSDHIMARRLPLAPLAGFLITIWSWTIYSSLDPLVRYVIPALHSIQYIYFVWLMKRNEAKESEGPPSFGPPASVRLGLLSISAIALGWVLFHGAPGLLDAAFSHTSARRGSPNGDLGATPFFAVFYVFVNLHHYFMDHVIWRRDNPDTRYLHAAPVCQEL